MSNKVLEIQKILAATKVVTSYLESQLEATKNVRINAEINLYSALVDEVNLNLDKIQPDFNTYLSKTIANFRSLNECYYYKNTSDTDTITIKNYLFSILESGSSFGRASITLPIWRLPQKAFIKFFKDLGINVQKSKTMSIFIQEIPRAKGDKAKYVCFNFNFRNI